MRIFFDHQTFSLQDFGGISRYYTELVSGINQTADNSAFLSLLISNNVHLKEVNFGITSFYPNHNFYKKLSLIYRFNQSYTIYKLARKSFDIFHATYYDPYFIPYLKGRPFVITFLDMIHEKLAPQFPELNNGGLTTKQKQHLADRADRIIAISESTKRDIIELLNVNPTKIDVIYLGSSLEPVHEHLTIGISSDPYLLFVGRRERYKNFEGLLFAIHSLLKKHKLKLLCAGGGSFTNDERRLINSFGVDALVKQCPVGDQTLQMLYRGAFAFVFPTMYEGFGIPILEAFACGCPCIVSNVSSLPEVAGSAALYIDPKSSDSISNAIEQLLNDSRLRLTLIQRGHEQLKLFSWQRTVDETLNLYKTLI